MLLVMAPLYAVELLHTFESMIFTKAFWSVGGALPAHKHTEPQWRLKIQMAMTELKNKFQGNVIY